MSEKYVKKFCLNNQEREIGHNCIFLINLFIVHIINYANLAGFEKSKTTK